jgi:hypothetical protein
MSFFNKFAAYILTGLLVIASAPGCRTTLTESSTSSSSSVATASSSSIRFADGVKAVRINTLINSTSGSFDSPNAVPSSSTTIPSTFPGYTGTATYLPGVSAVRFFELNGTNLIATKPSWLLDFQLGITSTSTGPTSCATFGGGGNLDVTNYYRVAEKACNNNCNSGSCQGSGTGTDPVFFRIVLDRDTTKIGSGENLLIQVEYQASGLHLNSDANGLPDVEDSLDQLWKIYWSDSLASTAPNKFGLFIPPNYSACLSTGNGITSAPGSCPNGNANAYRGSPIKVRQFMIPLSAYPDMKVIQFSRVKGRIEQSGGTVPGANYVNAFCKDDEPLCLGVVIRSVSLMRI